MKRNDKHSCRDYTHLSFVDVDPAEFNDTEIVGTCFYQESLHDEDSLGAQAKDPSVAVFPPGMTGVLFARCNLDNVVIPPGNTVGERCCHRKIRVQNDLEDWVLSDVDHRPVEPIDLKRFEQEEKSTDPKDIPASKIEAIA